VFWETAAWAPRHTTYWGLLSQPDKQKLPNTNLHSERQVSDLFLIYFAAYKKHIGLYPAPRGNEKFKEELPHYEGGKGTVRFTLDKPIPYSLIARIVKFGAKENLERAKPKKGS
jgi:hypothetical protein